MALSVTTSMSVPLEAMCAKLLRQSVKIVLVHIPAIVKLVLKRTYSVSALILMNVQLPTSALLTRIVSTLSDRTNVFAKMDFTEMDPHVPTQPWILKLCFPLSYRLCYRWVE